ncbi:MAG: transporter [Rickettsiaceae bacterium]|jgi:lipoprotein-releasing system ATP-binding protein|nr:transporter [Rickettsiaceae bacterium]
MHNLILKNIDKSFLQGKQKISVIKNANLAIKKGESVALLGSSGAGKTTLLQIAGLLDNPDCGEIFVNNIEATKANDEVRTGLRKNHLGFIYQFHHLFPEFSALENVAMPLLIKGVAKKTAYLEATELLAEIGLQDRLDHLPSQLSGGQQQRVAVARAVITKPSVLLADEPTGNLDSENSDNVFKLILEFSKKYQISSLIVTHNIELAKKLDRIVTIKDGMLE